MPTGDRDRVVDQLLRASAGDLLAAPGPDCVDAEMLAAWSEGGLDRATSQRIERHLATCAPCQMMAAAFVRSDVAAPAPARATWGLRWFVPVAVAAAAAIAIWVLVPRQPAGPMTDQKVAMNQAPATVLPPPTPATGGDIVTPEAASPAPPPEAASRQESAAKAEMSPPALGDRSGDGSRAGLRPAAPVSVAVSAPSAPPAAALPPPPAPQVPAQRESVQVTADVPLIQAQSGERSFAVTSAQVENLPVSRGNFTGLTAAVPADASSRDTRVGGAGQNNIQMDGVSALDAGSVARVVAEFAATGSSALPAAEPASARSAGREGSAAALEASRSAPPTRWRVLADGRVQRSLTGGASWDVMAIDATLRVTTGSAPSTMVCWLIGPSGVVLRATDRLHFERLAFPEAVDLMTIRAASDREASVTTRDGRTFATTDGGKTWRSPER